MKFTDTIRLPAAGELLQVMRLKQTK